jgi:hypothetical protein
VSIFKRKPTVAHQGVVDRIGQMRASDFGLVHGFTLKGDSSLYITTPGDLVGRQCLTREGDVVSFLTKEKEHDVVPTTFVNETLRNGRTSLDSIPD